MKVRIREGNDFDVAWAIKRAGQPEDLSTATSMKLTLVVYGLVIEHSLFTVTDNMLSINIPKEVVTTKGDYRLVFEYTLPDAGQPDGDLKCKTDVVPFRIVPFSADADDVYTVNTSSDVLFGFKGDKGDDGDDAYQIWLDLGNVGTYEDFIAYMRQPAVDAGSSISELEGEIQVSEGLRVQAESERDLSEATRLQSESERSEAEIIRQSNEGNRIENEATRVQNEAERISKENVRQNSEVDRLEAEEVRLQAESERVSAETARVNAEGDATKGRVKAENERVQAESERAQAETARVNAEGDATKGRVKAENERVAAEGERAQAFAQMMGEADDKIQEMDTTLSTYDGRVTQVESDISQLAGDVSLLDAVHGAKIKDIENILSTSNPSQSAQISVSGVSPLALPKNASNGGMSIKLEGLTDAGVNFTPTGRIRSVGKNLFNKEDITPNKVVIANGALTNSSIANASNYIRVQGGLSYYISGRRGSSFIAFYDNGYGFISSIVGTNITMSAPTNAVFARFSISHADMNTCKFERGVIATAYEPYRETSLYLSAPELRSNGTVKDEIRKGANGYELVKRISSVDGTVLATPITSPISYGGILNSAENGTVYHEPVIADAGVYDTKMDILLTDYPIASIEEIIKHENGVDTYLNVATTVIAPDGLSFTHPDLASGDLVLFTYAFDKESTNGNITATFYDSNVVKIDTVTGKAYRINEVVTNGVLTRTLTEV